MRCCKYIIIRLKYLGWDFVSIQRIDTDISGEIVPLYIEIIQIYRMRLLRYVLSRLKYIHIRLNLYITIIRIWYIEWDWSCLQRLQCLSWKSLFTLSEFIDNSLSRFISSVDFPRSMIQCSMDTNIHERPTERKVVTTMVHSNFSGVCEDYLKLYSS